MIKPGSKLSKSAVGGGLLLLALCCLAILSGLVGCELSGHGEPDHYQPQYGAPPPEHTRQHEVRFGIHPLHNPLRLFERYGPIVDYLNQHITDAHFVLEASRDYQEFESKLQSRSLDLALPNPYQTLIALRHNYKVFGKMGDDSIFRGLLLVRKDSGIENITQLRGNIISFPSATALAACMQPQHEMQRLGLPFGSYEASYVGSQESSIMNVLLGNSKAGGTWPTPWLAFQKEHPEQAGQLKVLLETPPLINNALVARDDFPAELLNQVSRLLFSLHEHAEGRKILAALPLEYFEAAEDEDYKLVDDFLADFNRNVRPIEH